MNTLKWILLCGVFAVYLLLGGSIIMLLEQRNEISQNQQLSVLRKDIQEILFRLDRDFYHNGTSSDILEAVAAAKEGVLNRISDSCGGKNLLGDENVDDKPLTWTFYNSVFFAFTAVTTIGYGNLTPAVPISRMFTILYALIGIPINGIIITGLSDYYSRKLVKAHKRSKDKNSYDARIVFIFDIIFYLIPGILVFIVAPAGFFVVIEKWTFIDSIYFCFVTLSTIGFGDYVAGLGDGHNLLLWLYKIVIIVWIMFGLGYLLMILSFITKGMTSKKVRTAIEKKLDGIRTTKEKLSKDINYMRRVVQELYLLKSKPTYPNENTEQDVDLNHRKISTIKYKIPDVRRNVSFNVSDTGTKRVVPTALARSHSESALDKISREDSNCDAINWAISDQLMANLVSEITGNMNEMIHAVDQLNEYEDNLNSDESDNENDEIPDPDNPEDDETPEGWRLEEFDSDEEILIEEDEDYNITDNKLEEVVVHSKILPDTKPETLMEKIGEAIRKISTGKRSVAETPSKKTSRNEEEGSYILHENENPYKGKVKRRTASNISRESCIHVQEAFDAASRRNSHNYLSRVGSHRFLTKKKLSVTTTHRNSNSEGFHKTNSDSLFQGEINMAFENSPHDTISHNMNHFDPGPSDRISIEHSDGETNKLSLERKSLQGLLKALDAVQDRLHHGELPERPNRTSTESHTEETRPHRRRRKIGIFNPDFSFLDSAFGKTRDKQHGV